MDIGALRPSPLAPASALRPGLSSEGGKDEILSVSQTRREHNTASEAILLSCQRQAGVLKGARVLGIPACPQGITGMAPSAFGGDREAQRPEKGTGATIGSNLSNKITPLASMLALL